ncbi:hypothetical protein N7466_011013 [Penicillium verhagenii]|uniref:uncharacterized protein n=1 Tax=Penicillium verhagenii TaxID=1562060 RepID=UPI0025453E23|nr:uncharacterized protein N7466_011013 [Penicillium verhagenii]KAJ5917459.1 hypothetical protein N7466_011013 [Penicillium verhagenii]
MLKPLISGGRSSAALCDVMGFTLSPNPVNWLVPAGYLRYRHLHSLPCQADIKAFGKSNFVLGSQSLVLVRGIATWKVMEAWDGLNQMSTMELSINYSVWAVKRQTNLDRVMVSIAVSIVKLLKVTTRQSRKLVVEPLTAGMMVIIQDF